MLMMEKRYPNKKFYMYGGVAFLASFVLATSLLASSGGHLGNFIGSTPLKQVETTQVATESDQSSGETESAPADQAAPPASEGQSTSTWSSRSTPRPTPTESQAPAQNSESSQPPTEQSAAPSETSTEPAPTMPTDPVAEPTPEEPGIIDPIIEILVPVNP